MIPQTVRIFVCPEPIDMRYGFDRLTHLCRERLGQDPVSGGALFVFFGGNAKRLKLLWFERNGVCLLYKRLHGAVFEIPVGEKGQSVLRIDSDALAKLLGGIPTRRAGRKNTMDSATTLHIPT